MFLASWSLQQTEQRLKSLTVIQFSNPFQTNVWAGDVHFPGVRNCELSSGMKWDLWDTRPDGGKEVRGVGEGSSSSSLGSWMSSWAQSWEPKPRWTKEGLWQDSDAHSQKQGVFLRDPKSSKIQCSFSAYFFFCCVICFHVHSPLPYPSMGVFIRLL